MVIENLTPHSGFAFHSLQSPHAREKCIAHAKARSVLKVPELIDLYWDGGPKGRSLDQAATVAGATEVASCPFRSTGQED